MTENALHPNPDFAAAIEGIYASARAIRRTTAVARIADELTVPTRAIRQATAISRIADELTQPVRAIDEVLAPLRAINAKLPKMTMVCTTPEPVSRIAPPGFRRKPVSGILAGDPTIQVVEADAETEFVDLDRSAQVKGGRYSASMPFLIDTDGTVDVIERLQPLEALPELAPAHPDRRERLREVGQDLNLAFDLFLKAAAVLGSAVGAVMLGIEIVAFFAG